MAVIDADCHVIENEHTWSCMDEADARLRPMMLTTPEGKRFMAIDGRLRAGGQGVFTDSGRGHQEMSGFAETSLATRTLGDIDARIKHMDELGIDVQVLYPTIYLQQITPRADTEVALNRSYNRWLADIWRQGEGRL